MKFAKVLASLFLVLMVCSAATMKSKDRGMYIVGVSASFTDSLIYFTDVQYMDSVALDGDKLLPMRNGYSEQLDNYLEQGLGLKNRTCFIYFDKELQKLQKTLKKMKEKYQKEGRSVLREVGPEFKFTVPEEY